MEQLTGTENVETAQDFEDASNRELLQFVPMPRTNGKG